MEDSIKQLTIKDLCQAFANAGYPKSQMWVRRQEAKGNLKLPRSTTDYKKPQGTRKIGFVIVLTEDQIKSILKAFLPGGTGYWDYTKK